MSPTKRRVKANDRDLAELAAVIAAFEAEHGEITPEEMDRAAVTADSRAVSVRGRAPSKRSRPRQRSA